MCIWVQTSELNAKRLRELYLRAVLRQDVHFFDNVGAGEVATRIQTDTRESKNLPLLRRFRSKDHLDLVHQGISEKVPLASSFLAAFVTGFTLAYLRNWRLALALSSILPCIAITGGFMFRALTKYIQYVDQSPSRLS